MDKDQPITIDRVCARGLLVARIRQWPLYLVNFHKRQKLIGRIDFLRMVIQVMPILETPL